MFGKNKRGQALAGVFIAGVGGVIAFAVLVIALSLNGQVLASQQSTQTVNSLAYNITGYGMTGVNNVAGLTPTMGLVYGIVLVLAILVSLLGIFAYQKMKG